MRIIQKIEIAALAVALTITGAFAAWTDTKSSGDAILSSDWNSMVQSSWDTSSGDVYRATGNVGIGTTDPNRKLHVADSSGAGYVQITSSTSGSTATDGLELSVGTDASVWNYETGYLRLGTANSEALRITSGGNVGIGTVSPRSILNTYSSSDPTLTLEISGDLSAGETGSIDFYANDTSGNGTGVKASIHAETTNAWGNNAELVFSTSDNSVLATERMRIDETGNVGIGTTNPEQDLHIDGGTGSAYLKLETDDGADTAIMGYQGATLNFAVGFDDTDDAVEMSAGNFSSNHLIIKTDGKVGIGTTSPGDTLHLSGSGTTEIQIESTGVDSDPALEIKNDVQSWKIQTNGTESDLFAIRDETSGVDKFVIHPTQGVGIGGYSATPSSLWVGNSAMDIDSSYYGLRLYHIKTAGTTDDTDNLYGIASTISINDADSTIGHLIGGDFKATVTSGNVGTVGSGDDLSGLVIQANMKSSGMVSDEIYGSYVQSNVDSGTVGGDIVGTYTNVDIEPAVTSIGGNVYGHYVWVDADKDPTGGAYGIWIRSLTNVDNAIYLDGTATAYCEAASCWTDASDASLKENITDLDYGLAEVLAMQPRRYLYKPSNESTIGLVAQELDDIIPEVVTGEDGSMGIGYGNLTPVLVSALQELKAEKDAEIAELTARIEALEMQN